MPSSAAAVKLPGGLGLCRCGCGVSTRIATRTDRKNGQVKGRPALYANGHHPKGRRTTPAAIDAARSRRTKTDAELKVIRSQNFAKAREGYMAKVAARKAEATPGPIAPVRREPHPHITLYRAEKERAEPTRKAQLAERMHEAKLAWERMEAEMEERARGGRPRKGVQGVAS